MTGVDEGNVTYPEFYPLNGEICYLFIAPALPDGESGDESLFYKGEEVESCTRCADRW